jgi:hypothetical protein
MEQGARRLTGGDPPENVSRIPRSHGDAEELGDVAPAGRAEPSLHQFHEWSIKRLERRVRKLTWAVGTTVVLALAILAALVLYDQTRPTDRIATTTAAEGALGPLRDDVSRLSGEVDALARGLEARIDRIEAAMEEAPPGTTEIGEALAEVRRELNGLRRCTSDAVRELDEGLRGLLAREIDANEWVERPPIEDCR